MSRFCRRCGFIHRAGAHPGGPFVPASEIVSRQGASDEAVRQAVEALETGP